MAEDRAATRVATRADALLNRERILTVSYPAFAADPKVSLNAIAKLAGVGPGTLYRHFPTREDLLLAVYQQEVQVLVQAVDGIGEQYPPLDALRVWFLRLADLVQVKHGLGEALQTAAAQHVVSQTYAPVTAAIGLLLAACAEAGEVRPGLDPADVLLLMGFLWRAGPDEAGRRQARRVLELAIRGLR